MSDADEDRDGIDTEPVRDGGDEEEAEEIGEDTIADIVSTLLGGRDFLDQGDP